MLCTVRKIFIFPNLHMISNMIDVISNITLGIFCMTFNYLVMGEFINCVKITYCFN